MKLNGFLYWFTIGCHLVVLISFIRCVLSALSSLSSFLSSFLSWCVCSIHPFTWFRLHGKIQSYVCPGKLVHTHANTLAPALIRYFGSKFDFDSFSLTAESARVCVCVCQFEYTFIYYFGIVVAKYSHISLSTSQYLPWVCVCKRFFSPACSFIHSPMFFCSLSFLPTAS